MLGHITFSLLITEFHSRATIIVFLFLALYSNPFCDIPGLTFLYLLACAHSTGGRFLLHLSSVIALQQTFDSNHTYQSCSLLEVFFFIQSIQLSEFASLFVFYFFSE